MQTVNVHAAKTHLSRLLQLVEGGEEVVIARAGRPVARLVRVETGAERVLGLDAELFTLPADIEDADPEIEAMFYGEGEPAVLDPA
ncbi:MAG: type II toxin-antitoxin system Phd/YefM family antitoxin [Dehalococcoidia bacterium]